MVSILLLLRRDCNSIFKKGDKLYSLWSILTALSISIVVTSIQHQLNFTFPIVFVIALTEVNLEKHQIGVECFTLSRRPELNASLLLLITTTM